MPIAEAAEGMARSEAKARRLIADRRLRSVSLSGIVDVLTVSNADRLGEGPLSRHNQDCERSPASVYEKDRWI